MNNPFEILKNFKGKNPQEIILNQMIGNIDNPILKNVIDWGKNKEYDKIDNFARNVCKQKGINYNDIIAVINQMK